MVALFGNRCNFGSFPDHWECWSYKRSIDDWRNKRECDQQAVLKDSSLHLVNPRSLIRRHCVYDVRDLFTINIIKCKLLTSRKTFRSKSVFTKNEVVLFSQRFNFRMRRFSDWCKNVLLGRKGELPSKNNLYFVDCFESDPWQIRSPLLLLTFSLGV